MNAFFKELFDYNQHCNQQLLDVFLAQPDQMSEKAVKLFHHLLNAHHIWNNRIQGKTPAYTVWQLHENNSLLQDILENNYKDTLQLLDSCDLQQVIAYKTSTGVPFENTTKDILFHVINHSTYHRAQIATEWKNNGVQPLSTDYVFYKR